MQQQQQLQSGPPHWAGGGGGGGPAADLGLQHMQPWFYRGMSREEATQLLLKHGTVDGVFLVRQSLTKPGSYVLCYVYRGKVHHVQIISVRLLCHLPLFIVITTTTLLCSRTKAFPGNFEHSFLCRLSP